MKCKPVHSLETFSIFPLAKTYVQSSETGNLNASQNGQAITAPLFWLHTELLATIKFQLPSIVEGLPDLLIFEHE